MDRQITPLLANRIATVGVLVCLVSTAGCSLMATTMWVINPNDVKAEYDGLQEKRVAVICQPDSTLPYQTFAASQQLADRVSILLAEKVDDVDIVRQAEVTDWTDHNELESPAELGAAMDADLVVVIALSDFRVRQGATMLQGMAHAEVEIVDVATGDVIHHLAPVDSTFPPKNGIPAELSNSQYENRFRSQFIAVLASQIARRFYDHDSRAEIKTDRYFRED